MFDLTGVCSFFQLAKLKKGDNKTSTEINMGKRDLT
jgi:hypothetical protein